MTGNTNPNHPRHFRIIHKNDKCQLDGGAKENSGDHIRRMQFHLKSRFILQICSKLDHLSSHAALDKLISKTASVGCKFKLHSQGKKKHTHKIHAFGVTAKVPWPIFNLKIH